MHWFLSGRNLPSTELRDAVWAEIPPRPIEDAALYEGVPLRRSIAFLIDFLLIGVAGIALWIAVAALNLLSLFMLTGLTAPLAALAFALLPLAYATYFIGNQGATLGMMLLDLEVRAWDGRTPGYAQGLLMSAFFYLSIMTTTWLILVVALFNERRRCLHDFMAGTVVVRRERLGFLAAQAS